MNTTSKKPLKALYFSLLAAVTLTVSMAPAYASESRHVIKIEWTESISYKMPDGRTEHYLNFNGAGFSSVNNWLPEYSSVYQLYENGQLSAEILNAVYEPLNEPQITLNKAVTGNDINITIYTCWRNKLPFACVSFIPIRYNNFTGKFEKLVSGELLIRNNTAQGPLAKTSLGKTWAASSVLQSGSWYKIGVVSTGIHRIDFNFLKSLNIDPASIDPRNIRIYGNGSGMLPHPNSSPRHDDLTENSIYVQGEGDGNFGQDDYILFYGQSPVTWTFDATGQRFKHQINYYSDTTYYFLNLSGSAGKRMATQPSVTAAANKTVTTFNDFMCHEWDKNSLIKSGREWFGEEFGKIPSHSFDVHFPNLDAGTDVYFKTELAARSFNGNTSFLINVGGFSQQQTISALANANYDADYIPAPSVLETQLDINDGNIHIDYTYNKSGTSTGWLDYFELHARRHLTMAGAQMSFRDAASAGASNIAEFIINRNGKNLQIWEVTNPQEVKVQQASVNGNDLVFRQDASIIREYITFDGSSYLSPASGAVVANQNLHGLPQADLIIVAPPEFFYEAYRLKDFHEKGQALKVHVVSPQNIYNEFSSGVQDIAAIRDFLKMFYDRAATPAEQPKYLLLFGDASYDFKNRVAGNTNFVPSFQSKNSYSPTNSYVSDDFYGLLDDNEGNWVVNEQIDIGIGRIPVKNTTEARQMVDKIIHYASPASFGEWRNELLFVADDGDANLHVNQTNQLASLIDTNYKDYHVQKLYLDAYPMQSSAGGNRYPDVTRIINETIDKGVLVVNYTGHGGETGWSHEKVLTMADIESWSNYDKLPIFVTATCEFSKFDDPGRTSAGEQVLLNPKGGGIALLTTVRLVYAWPNYILNKAFYEENVFKFLAGNKPPLLGDIIKTTKNNSRSTTGDNSRNFTLLGDPALVLAYPKYNVATISINNKPVSSVPDTLKALSKISISGAITNDLGQIDTTFNGVVFPTVFDKPSRFATQANDPASSVANFQVQKNIIYKGRASVVKGVFTFTFVVPKDISYQFGYGKITYYAHNNVVDANGYYNNIIIGGTASNVAADTKGPEIKLTMNDDRFIFGGTTDENPTMIAKLKDENGINTVGNGIGHEITGVLDGNTENIIILNSYYQAALDDHTQGEIRYKFTKLSPGLHTLKVKVWDVYNNSSEAYTEFVVANSAEIALDHVLNYPNPFNKNTTFHFDHNQPGQPLDVQVQILTIAGRVVKTLNTAVSNEGTHFSDLYWDGLDEFGDKIANGVYVYKVKVKTPDGRHVEKIEKLVILN